MWTRAELKNRAKMCLSRYYWAAFAVSLIFAILSGFGGSNANTQRVTSYLEQNATGSSRDDQSGLLIGELGGDGSLSGSTQTGSSLSLDLATLTDREPEMPDPWLRATCFTVFSRERWSLL